MNSQSDPKVGLHLEVLSGNGAGTDILVEDELVIGRHATGAGRLADDTEISRQHARISREVTGDYAIEDLGSSNGTFVNGLQIFSPRLLALGDSIELGATALVVRLIAREPPPAAPAPTEDTGAHPGYAATVLARSPVVDAPSPAADTQERPAPEPAPAAVAAGALAGAAAAAPPEPEPEPEPAVVPAAAAPLAEDTAKSPTPQWPPSLSEAPAPAAEDAQAAPAEPAEPAPSPSPEAEAAPVAAGAARLELSLDIDFDARSARIALGDGDVVTLVQRDGRWQAQTGS